MAVNVYLAFVSPIDIIQWEVISCLVKYLIYTDGSIYKKKYNTDTTFLPTAFLNVVIDSYNSVTSYKPFEGSTQSSAEGRWLGYKHSNFGIAIVISKGYVFAIYLKTENSITSVIRQRILIDINN